MYKSIFQAMNILYDISRYTDEQIKGEAIDRISMTIMRDIRMIDSPCGYHIKYDVEFY